MSGISYTGKEWRALINEMTPRQVRNVLRRAYRSTAKVIRRTALSSLSSSGLSVRGNVGDWKKGVRTRIYSRGGGFMVTVKGTHGKSVHRTRRGILKPVLMWAEDGTTFRKTRSTGLRKSHYTGRMPKYGFIERAEPTMYAQVERELFPRLEQAVMDVARKAGWL